MEIKEFKKVLLTNKKTSRNEALQQRFHQRTKNLGFIPYKMIGTIFKVDRRRTSTNEPKNKKTNNDASTDYMCQEKKEEENSSALKIAMRGLKDFIKKSKERLITTI